MSSEAKESRPFWSKFKFGNKEGRKNSLPQVVVSDSKFAFPRAFKDEPKLLKPITPSSESHVSESQFSMNNTLKSKRDSGHYVNATELFTSAFKRRGSIGKRVSASEAMGNETRPRTGTMERTDRLESWTNKLNARRGFPLEDESVEEPYYTRSRVNEVEKDYGSLDRKWKKSSSFKSPNSSAFETPPSIRKAIGTKSTTHTPTALTLEPTQLTNPSSSLPNLFRTNMHIASHEDFVRVSREIRLSRDRVSQTSLAPSLRDGHSDESRESSILDELQNKWKSQIRSFKAQLEESENRKRDMWIQIQQLISQKYHMQNEMKDIADNNAYFRRECSTLEERIAALHHGLSRTRTVERCANCYPYFRG